jgi:hypothetical protein
MQSGDHIELVSSDDNSFIFDQKIVTIGIAVAFDSVFNGENTRFSRFLRSSLELGTFGNTDRIVMPNILARL